MPFSLGPLPPSISSPSDNATGVSINPTLSWYYDSTLTYDVQVLNGSTVVWASSSIASGSVTVPSLSYSTYYTWQVRAYDGSAYSDWSVAHFTTQGAPLPSTPTIVSPLNNASGLNPSISGITFQWNTSSGASTYDWELWDYNGTTLIDSLYNATQTTTVNTGNLGWSTSYKWRVRAKNSTGYSAWSAWYVFTTKPIPVPNNTSSITVSLSNPVRPHITWQSVTYASYYNIKIKNSMATIIYDQNVTGLSFDVPADLYYETGYTVTVAAVNTSGSSAGLTKSFTTGNTPTIAAPTSLSPATGATGLATSPTITWTSSEASFEIQIASDSSFSTIVESGTATSGSYTVAATLNWSTKYYYRVRAKRLFNSGTLAKYSAWSSSDFTIKAIPVPSAPTVSGSVSSLNTINFSWNAVTYASTYNVIVKRVSDNYVVYSASGITGTSVSFSNQYYESDFICTVTATNSSGTSSSGSKTITTGTFPTPAVPTSLSPVAGTTEASTTPALSWTGGSANYAYDIQMAMDSSFAVVDVTGSSSTTSFTPSTALNWNSKYYWRVRAKELYNGGTKTKYSAYSSAVDLTTTIPIATTPVVTASIKSGTSNTIVVSWNNQSYIDSYHVVVKRGSTTVFDNSTITGTSVEIPNMYYETSHSITVTATNRLGTSSAGSASVTTGSAPTVAVPTGLTPATGTTGVSEKPTVSWTSSESSFEVQISTSTTFTSSYIVASGTPTSTSFTSSVALDWSTKYYWRVRAKHTYNGGTLPKYSAWSSAINFTVKPIPVPADVADITITFPTPTKPHFAWGAVTYADHYHITISKV